MTDLEELIDHMRKVRGVDNVGHVISLNRVEKDMLLDEIDRLRAALAEIAACPQKRHRADGDVDVYYNGATMLKIAKEALGDQG